MKTACILLIFLFPAYLVAEEVGIVGADDRADVDLKDPKYRHIGKTSAGCTASLIGADIILLADHCDDDGEFFLGHTFGGIYSAKARMVGIIAKGGYLPPPAPHVHEKDWKIVRLDRPISSSWMKVRKSKVDFDSRTSREVEVVGYPGNRNGGNHPVFQKCQIDEVYVKGNFKGYGCDITGGNSGGPVMSCEKAECEIIGVVGARVPFGGALANVFFDSIPRESEPGLARRRPYSEVDPSVGYAHGSSTNSSHINEGGGKLRRLKASLIDFD